MLSPLHEPVDALVVAALLDAAPGALFALSADRRVLSWNRGAETLFGYSSAEAIGQALDELVVPDEAKAATQTAVDVALASGKATLETVRRHKGGVVFDVDMTIRRLATADGTPVLAVSETSRDIAERRQLEQGMQEASRLKSEFLANMSHELRTPLNSIIGFAELMHRGKLGAVSPEHEEYLGDILTSARHLLQLINDVLDLAKVESGKMPFRAEPVEMAKLASEVREVLRGLAASKRLRVDIRVDPEVAVVVIDPGPVKQVLYNYLSNAIKFTPDGGSISVRVAPANAAQFAITVKDSGVGISRDDLAKLFVEFQQLDASVAKRYQGTGLGLALTKRLAEALGGRVAVTSTAGVGSEFSAWLPRAMDLTPPDAPPNLPATAHGRETILAVDDDPTALRLVEAVVRELGWECVTADRAEEALAMCAADLPALAIVDLIMPGIDGLEFISRLRATAAGATVPVIVWSVKDLDAHEHERLRRAGASFVAKGRGAPETLAVEVRRLLALSRPVEAHGR